MERRVGRVLHQALGLASPQRPPTLPWCRHLPQRRRAAAARLRARASASTRRSPIHDRGDSEDLLDLVRQRPRLRRHEARSRFPQKGTCLAIYSRAVNARTPLADVLPRQLSRGAREHEAELKRLFAAYVAEKQAQHVLDFDDLLLYWAQMLGEPRSARHVGAALRPRARRRVPGHQPPAGRDRARAEARRPRPHRRRRRRAVRSTAFAPPRCATSSTSRAASTPPARVVTLERNYRSTQPILDASNAVIALAARAPRQGRCGPTARRRERPQLVTGRGRGGAGALGRRARARAARGRAGAEERRRCCFAPSHHSAALELELARRNIPFVKYGGLQFLEAAHVKDVLAVLRWAENPRGRLAGFRVAQLVPGIGAATRQARCSMRWTRRADPAARAARASSRRPARAHDWRRSRRCSRPARRRRAVAGASCTLVEPLVRAAARAAARRRRTARADLAQLARLAAGYPSRERFLTELTLDPPAATSDEAGAAAARRGLPDPVDDPFGEGPGVAARCTC